MNTIDIQRVTRRFGSLTAVDGVSLDVAPGEIVGLLGHNGAGKTTLIRVINGLLAPDLGHVRVLGRDPSVDGQRVRAATGVLTVYPALDDFLSVEENLAVYAAINGVSPRIARRRIHELLEQLDLTHKRDERARGLSAGLKQRVALARALVHDPQVLLLDEPTTNLDPLATRQVRDLIHRSSREQGRSVLLSTHNLAEAEQLCDRVAILRAGRLLAVGPPAQLRRSLGAAAGVRIETADGDTRTVVRTVNGSAASVSIEDDTVEVMGRIDIPDLVGRLAVRGVAIRRVEPIEPSLEDLYVSYHERPAPVAMGVAR